MSAEFLEYVDMLNKVARLLTKANKAQAALEEAASHLPGHVPVVRSILDDACIRQGIKDAKALDLMECRLQGALEKVDKITEVKAVLQNELFLIQGLFSDIEKKAALARLAASSSDRVATINKIKRLSASLGLNWSLREAKRIYDA